MDINNKRILATSVLILLVCGVYLFVLEKDIKEMREQNRQILNSLGELNSKVNTLEQNTKTKMRQEIEAYIKEQEEKEQLVKEKLDAEIAERLLADQKARQEQHDSSADIPLVAYDAGDKIYGSPKAEMSIYVFSDLDCPYCARMNHQVKQLIDSSKGNVNLVYRHFPLQLHGEQAVIKGMMAECANKHFGNEKFWLAIDDLYDGMGYEDFKKKYNLTDQQLKDCLKDKSLQNILISQAREGEELDVVSTPTFFILDRSSNQKAMVTDVQHAGQLKEVIGKLVLQRPTKQITEQENK